MTETDSEFETFLRRRTVLPNGMSDDDKLEPPKALDAIVLKQAREAIRAQEQVSRAPRWARPVAIAATILLCLSIVLNVSLNTNRPVAGLQRMTAATADKTSPAPAAAAPAGADERREGAAEGTISHGAILPEAKVAESYAPRSSVLAEAAKPAPDESLRANSLTADKPDALAKRGGTPMLAPSEAPPAANSAEKATRLADRSGAPRQAPTEAPAAAAPGSASDGVTVLESRAYADTAAARAPATVTREAAASSASGAVTNAPSRSAAGPATPKPSVMASAAPPPPAPAPALPSSSAGVPADRFTSVTVTAARRAREGAFQNHCHHSVPQLPINRHAVVPLRIH